MVSSPVDGNLSSYSSISLWNDGYSNTNYAILVSMSSITVQNHCDASVTITAKSTAGFSMKGYDYNQSGNEYLYWFTIGA